MLIFFLKKIIINIIEQIDQFMMISLRPIRLFTVTLDLTFGGVVHRLEVDTVKIRVNNKKRFSIFGRAGCGTRGDGSYPRHGRPAHKAKPPGAAAFDRATLLSFRPRRPLVIIIPILCREIGEIFSSEPSRLVNIHFFF